MLNTLFDNLTAYFSKRALIAAFFPVVIFLALNGVIARFAFPDSELVSFEPKSLDLTQTTIAGTIAIVLGTIIMYALSAQSSRMREWLTGRGWIPFVREPLVRAHCARLDAMTRRIAELQELRVALEERRKEWNAAVLAARNDGRKTGQSKYHGPAAKAAASLKALRAARTAGRALQDTDLTALKDDIVASFKANSDQAGDDGFKNLENLQLELQTFLDYEEARLDNESHRLYSKRQSMYGEGVVEATRVGNIAQSIETYAISRYGMHLEVFWSRLQEAMADKTYYNVVQDAKAQLDFFVATFWLVVVSLAFWIVALPLTTEALALFGLLVVAAPLAAWWLYGLIVDSYVSFADLIRGAVDLYRFDLLKALHVEPPPTLTTEQALWKNLNQIVGYGADFDQQYKHV